MDATNAAVEVVVQNIRRVGLPIFEEERLRAKLRQACPSEPWVDAQFREVEDRDDQGNPLVCRTYDRSVFPPGGKHTLMVRCGKCGVLTPPVAMDGEICLDHGDGRKWGPSPSAIAIFKLRYYYEKLQPIELEPESQEALEKEISRYYQTSLSSHP